VRRHFSNNPADIRDVSPGPLHHLLCCLPCPRPPGTRKETGMDLPADVVMLVESPQSKDFRAVTNNDIPCRFVVNRLKVFCSWRAVIGDGWVNLGMADNSFDFRPVLAALKRRGPLLRRPSPGIPLQPSMIHHVARQQIYGLRPSWRHV